MIYTRYQVPGICQILRFTELSKCAEAHWLILCSIFLPGCTTFLCNVYGQIRTNKVLGSTSVLRPPTLRLRRASSTFSSLGSRAQPKGSNASTQDEQYRRCHRDYFMVKWSQVKTSEHALTTILLLLCWIAAVISPAHNTQGPLLLYTVVFGSVLAGCYAQTLHADSHYADRLRGHVLGEDLKAFFPLSSLFFLFPDVTEKPTDYSRTHTLRDLFRFSGENTHFVDYTEKLDEVLLFHSSLRDILRGQARPERYVRSCSKLHVAAIPTCVKL